MKLTETDPVSLIDIRVPDPAEVFYLSALIVLNDPATGPAEWTTFLSYSGNGWYIVSQFAWNLWSCFWQGPSPILAGPEVLKERTRVLENPVFTARQRTAARRWLAEYLIQINLNPQQHLAPAEKVEFE